MGNKNILFLGLKCSFNTSRIDLCCVPEPRDLRSRVGGEQTFKTQLFPAIFLFNNWLLCEVWGNTILSETEMKK